MIRVAAVLVAAAAPAQAAVQPCYLDQMVADAAAVVQVAEIEVGAPDSDGGCALGGIVARSFRGDVAEGDRLDATFACENPDNLAGGTIYHDAGAVASAGAVELHLDPDGAVAGYGWGLMLLDAPTDSPAFRFEHLPAGGEC